MRLTIYTCVIIAVILLLLLFSSWHDQICNMGCNMLVAGTKINKSGGRGMLREQHISGKEPIIHTTWRIALMRVTTGGRLPSLYVTTPAWLLINQRAVALGERVAIPAYIGPYILFYRFAVVVCRHRPYCRFKRIDIY